MQTQRLKRLMRLMVELPAKEFRSAEAIYGPLGVSRSQFYRDKAELEKMGFAFTYNWDRGAFALEEDPGVKIEGLTLSEVLALILAVGRLPETGDFTLAFRAMSGLRKIVMDHPGPAAELVIQAVDQVALRDACGCDYERLEILVEAVNEKRRIHLVYGRPDGDRERRLNVDPLRLVFRRSELFLETDPTPGVQRLYRVAYIRDVRFTPFRSIDS